MAGIGKLMGTVLNGKPASIPHGVPGSLPFTSGPRGTARTGRDEMRTGGGLSFYEGWSSPCRSAKALPIE